MASRPPAAEARVGLDVDGAIRVEALEHRAEQTVRLGQRTEPFDQLLAHARGEELGEAALAVRDAQRGVAGVHQAARNVDQSLQHVLDLEVRRHRQDRVAHLAQRRTETLGHLVARIREVDTQPGNGAGRLIGSGRGPLAHRSHLGHSRQLARIRGGARRHRQRGLGRGLVPRRHRRLRPAAEPLRRGGARRTRTSACSATTTSPRSARRPRRLLARRCDERALDDRRCSSRTRSST